MSMAEVTSTNLDAQMLKDKQRIREEMGQIEELSEIVFVPGLEESVGYFPLLENLPGSPIKARFSYGFKSPNMSAAYFDAEKGESRESGLRNARIFLESQKFDTIKVVQALGKFEGNEPQIEEVSADTDKNEFVGNVLFTRDPRVVETIKMADCPSGVLYCKDGQSRPVAGIIHGGAQSLVYGMARQGLMALNLELGVDLADAKLAIYPGMKDYTLSRFWKTPSGEVKRRYDGLYPLNVGEYLAPAKTNDPLEPRIVDLTSIFEMQALQAGMRPENMQVYRVDTYADAGRGRVYSRRFTNDHNGMRPGGNLLAVQLKAA